MDMFGAPEQGINYNIHRPSPPYSFLNEILIRTRNHNRYLDIATGTGKLLLHFAPKFSFSCGIDISKKMIETVTELARPYPNIDLQLIDVLKYQSESRFDLITIGQALHFMPRREVFSKVQSLLSENGVFATTGYLLEEIDSEHQGIDYLLFKEFYDGKIKEEFSFDRDELHHHYLDKEKYPFEEYFKIVTRSSISINIEMQKQEYIAYLKTMSGYQNYKSKYKIDPIEEIEKKSSEKVIAKFSHFMILCE